MTVPCPDTSENLGPRTGGQIVIEQFIEEGVDRIFCVPGESYLAVLDALYDVTERIDLVSCRHESGATMMAAASGQLTGRPGVAFVTRGPGATNASIAVHIAQQASIPLVLCVGQVSLSNLGRESFQEVDYVSYFAPIAKQVRQIDNPDDIAEAIAEAFYVACAGRMGPVVLAFPEDVLRATATPPRVKSRRPEVGHLDSSSVDAIGQYLKRATKPLIIVGGNHWRESAREQLHRIAFDLQIPVCAAFRRQDIFDNGHPCYGGALGFHTEEHLWHRVENADCILVIGARLDEPTTRGYRTPRAQRDDQILIHIHPDETQLGLNFVPHLAIAATADCAISAIYDSLHTINAQDGSWCAETHAAYQRSTIAPQSDAPLELGAVMRVLNTELPEDAIVTLDAGNFTVWPQRYRSYARAGRLLAPINGAMGYGVPAAIAASLTHPGRCVVACVGDGGMLMTGMELATATKYGAKPIILVFNNQSYGTIKTHQDRQYPGRTIGTNLRNPDFSAFARSFGAFGARVERDTDFAEVLQEARDAERVAVIELCMAPALV